MKNILSKTVWTLGIAALVMTGCKNSEEQYVRLSDLVCTFQGSGNEPYTITVDSEPEAWRATANASWVSAENVEGKLVLTVSDNTDGSERTTTVDVVAGKAMASISVIQLGENDLPVRYRLLKDLHSAVISPNGKLAAGYYSVADAETGTAIYYFHFINLDTDEKTELGPWPESLMFPTSVTCMTDTGIVYAIDANGGMKAIDMNEKNFYAVEVPGIANASSLGINSVSGDGEFWVGYAMENGHYRPFVFENGQATMLPLLGKDFRDIPYDGEDFDLMARGFSADRSIIYGTTWDNQDYGMVYWDAERNVHFVGEDERKVRTVQRNGPEGEKYDYNIVDGMISWSSQFNISPNGKWIAGTYRKEELVNDGDKVEQTEFAAFYNVEANKTYIFEEYGAASGMCVNDEGIGFIGLPSMYTSKTAVVRIETGEALGSFQDYIYGLYGVRVPEGFLQYVTPDGKRFWAATLSSEGIAMTALNWYLAVNQ